MNKGMLRAAGAALLSGALLYGCAAAPEQPQPLKQAEDAYAAIKEDPKVQQNAPVALHQAEQTLQKARNAWQEDKKAEARHLGYLAEQRMAIARARAQAQLAEKEVNQLGEERRQVLLEARRRDAELAQQEAQRAESRAQKLEAELAQFQAQVRQTDRGVVLTLGDVLFGFDKAQLNPGSARNLQPLVNFLAEYPDRRVVIEGHTDSIGPQDYNEELSKERANAVAQYLVQNGISPQRVQARGFGEQYPVSSNENAAGRQQNRRVNVVILKEGASPSAGPAQP